ncbi:MAG: MEDS domain-containing protein [Acidobacteriota bacterium]
MPTELRKTGISVLGDLPWGTHFCHFYETKEDLLDILFPYFKTGLANNALCVWVVSDPFDEETARSALRNAFPEADRHLAAGDIEIAHHLQWYLKGSNFDAQWVINGWQQKLDEALSRGYTGLRVNGIAAWRTDEYSKDFAEYEKQLNDVTTNQRMIALCAYPFALSKATDMFDVAHAHEFALARRSSKWEILEAPEIVHAKAEIKRLNEDLEFRAVERTNELSRINEDLKRELTERQRAEEALRASEERFRRYFELGLIGMAIISPAREVIEVNEEFCQILGYERNELVKMDWSKVTHPDDLRRDLASFNRVLAGELDGYSMEKRFICKDGQITHATIALKCSRREDGSVNYFVALIQDVTKRKLAEAQLKRSNEDLRALSARMQSVREEESMRIARAIHNDLGGSLTALKIDLWWLAKRLSKSDAETMREKVDSMSDLIDETILRVRSIATELRPSVLDHHGLGDAIEAQASEFQRRMEIECRITAIEEEILLGPETSTAVFRILQEILTNVARHAVATVVEISLVEHNGDLVLRVSDNGVGISSADIADTKSLGMLGMRERAAIFGGRVEIVGESGKGTTVTVNIPL